MSFKFKNKPRGNNSGRKSSSNNSKPSRNSSRSSNRSSNNFNRSRGGKGRPAGRRGKFVQKRASMGRHGVIDKTIYISDPKPEVKKDVDEYIGKSYSDFDLGRLLSENLQKKGYKTTTEIQTRAIPLIMEGKDVLGISETGSGKTGAFLIPMINKLAKDRNQKLLVVAPTRELAIQIAKEGMSFARGMGLNISQIIGGESMSRQRSQLRKGDQIIVGTPGRINDLIRRNIIKPSQYNNFVIDEVDRMLDMGFITDIRFIHDSLSANKQTLFFSATHNKSVEKIVSSLSQAFDIIKLSNNKPKDSIVQSVIDFTHSEEKLDILKDILNRDDVSKAIIFVDTKRYADKVEKALFQKGFKVGVIHGNKTQNFRKKVIEKFKFSKINILVATNVAARGIDIDDITHVINLDEPQTYDEYIHRIGRTGRNGSVGTAYTFVAR